MSASDAPEGEAPARPGRSGLEPAAARRRRPLDALLLPLGMLLLAGVLYGLVGHEGSLRRDDSLFVYSGQQLARGVPPYVSTFHAKTPLSVFLCGLGVALADVLGADDLVVVRYLFLLLAALCAVAVQLLASELFRSRAAGLVAALVFVGFWGFGVLALSGPHAKAPMVLFQTLSLWLAARRRWFGAALCGSLAGLVWQPMGVYALAALALAALQSPAGALRRRSLSRALGGAALPPLLLLLFFLLFGGLREFFADTVIFNLFYLERQQELPLGPFWAAVQALDDGYARMKIPFVLGLLATCALLPWRLARCGGLRGLLREDRFAALLLTFPVAVVWSLLDFQSYPDHYVFLAYAAVACGGLLHRLLLELVARRWLPQRGRVWVLALTCAALVLSAGQEYSSSRSGGLARQRQWAAHLAELAGPQGSIVSLGVPQALVLLRRSNPNPHVFLCCGMLAFLDDRTPGGFDAWLRGIVDAQPAAIVVEGLRGPVGLRLAPQLPEYRRVRVGGWFAFVRKRSRPRGPSPQGFR